MGYLFFLIATILVAQDVKSDLTGLDRGGLWIQARINGTVSFTAVTQNGKTSIRLVTGHPLLYPIAAENLKKWVMPEGKVVNIRYHFQAIEPARKTTLVPKGDGLDRLFLRLFRRPTEREVSVCIDPDEKDKGFKVWREGGGNHINVHVHYRALCPVYVSSTT